MDLNKFRYHVEDGLVAFAAGNYPHAEYHWSMATKVYSSTLLNQPQTEEIVDLCKVMNYHRMITQILLNRPRSAVRKTYNHLRLTLDLARDREMFFRARRIYWFGKRELKRYPLARKQLQAA